jgi:RNA polymerase subunit RPABC4/transcription elongation factor Spt4
MMTECPECKQSVSDSAEVCPGCGYRLAGRENMVYCPRCKTNVIPEVHGRDTISRYCPLCNKPITGLVARWVFLAIVLVFALWIVGTLLGWFPPPWGR